MNHSTGLPVLLSAAATVLEAITEDLPPLTVDCDPRPPVGSPVTIPPTASADEVQVQQHVVEHLADILGTWARPIEHGPGWIGRAQVPPAESPSRRWPSRSPAPSTGQVTESQNGDGLRVNLEVDPEALASVLEAHAIFTPGPAGSWDRSRGIGLTPTGHELTISTR